MLKSNLYEAKARLSELVQAALDGEEVIIARSGKPAVRLVPVRDETFRTGGWGSLAIDADALDRAFDRDVEEAVARLFDPGSAG